MITKVVIRDNTKSAVPYISQLPGFTNGTEYIFKPGVNIIIGENGSGKSTLMKLIECYTLVDKTECSRGLFNSNINRLMGLSDTVPDGIGVYGDYTKNIFRLCHSSEKSNDDVLSNANSFGEHYLMMHSSTGEGMNIAVESMFMRAFSKDAKLFFDYHEVANMSKSYKSYGKYVDEHTDRTYDEWTFLMDEPDRNLDITNIDQIRRVLSFHKERTQIIAVVHNPLLLYSLSNEPSVNFIEMTGGYLNKVKNTVNNIIK